MPDFQEVNTDESASVDIAADERVRVLESRYALMRDRLFLINQNMLTEYKKLNKDIGFISDELKNLKLEMNEIKTLLRNIVNEMQGFARKEEVRVVEKYLEIMNPLNFMTEKDVKRIIRGEYHSKNNKRSADRED